MRDGPHAATISVTETLALLDGNFKTFADGVAEGRYAFWLGSGISLTRFPGLKDLVERVLEFLRKNVDQDNLDCPFRRALDRAFVVAALTTTEKEQTDLTVSVTQWSALSILKERLAGSYSTFLNIDIDGERSDLLVWEGISVAETYGDPDVEPDAEHLALAVLVREGLVQELASANWDGLVEKAGQRISDGTFAVDVCVRSEDLQDANNSTKLIKFHGCAICARKDEEKYRPYIVGRQSQVDAWRDDPKMQGLIEHLRSLIIERPTLMLGLSVQDYNIRSLFGQASKMLKWSWPGDRPAYVFSEDEVSEGQISLLQNVYQEHYEGAERAAVRKSAHLPAYAKPLLCALIVYAYAAKLRRLSMLSGAVNSAAMSSWVYAGIEGLRGLLASADDGDHLAFISKLITQISRTKTLFLSGIAQNDLNYYEPIYSGSVNQIGDTLEIRNSGMIEAAVAAAILGAGVLAGDWVFGVADPNDPKAGIAVIITPEQTSRLFVVASAHAEHELLTSGRIEEHEDVILIQAHPPYQKLQRSPRRAPGRTGEIRPRRVSIPTLLNEASGPEALMERFKMELAV